MSTINPNCDPANPNQRGNPMDEIQYYEMQEMAAIGQIISACAKAIFDAYDAETMGELQHSLYKYTDAGICISFELHEGCPGKPFVHCGDKRADEIKEPWNWIRQIGASSIVEGSDAEVPLEWIDLIKYSDPDKYGGDCTDEIADIAKIAVNDFEQLCIAVNDEACALWEESNVDSK